MNDLPLNELIEHFLDERRNGKDYSAIRNELNNRGLEESVVKNILRDIDRQILLEDQIKVQRTGTNEMIWIGLVLIVIGIVITIGSLVGIFNIGNSIIVNYGPVVAGVGIFLTGIRRRKRLELVQGRFKKGLFKKR
ncbi:hypothetical protein SLH46_20535 [Draconibacterium sp. IB214405]|uniref:hypothetical protein n=1 Tax=Draconibacterium sp. IB214405 TaxID=3097352 RepID=UPI002A0B10B3|nr:hypothetical protein [Draconibacterium sp. IB214405]MDX8341598.1 hypothetical protein [Draconibacterium sp. IB214405]